MAEAEATILYANAQPRIFHVFVRDYVTHARIGVYDRELKKVQPIRINVDIAVSLSGPLHDNIDNVVCYHNVVKGIDSILSEGHIKLVETLAEKIAEFCLLDPRALSAKVRVEKLAAIAGAASVGVEIKKQANR